MRTKVVVCGGARHIAAAPTVERSKAEKLAKYLKKKIEDDEEVN
jgi:hypothetical protein